MDRLSPQRIAEPEIPGSGGGSVARTGLYAVLALMLAAGGWVRFNQQIATVAPAIAAPAAAATQQAANAAAPKGLVEAQLVQQAAAPAAVAGLGLDQQGRAAMLDALKRDRLRLIQMPLFDAGPSAPDGSDAGRSILVSTAGFSRLVHIGRQPVTVTLPIDRAGTVSFAPTTGAAAVQGGIGVGALTTTGPVVLPGMGPGQQLEVGVVAE